MIPDWDHPFWPILIVAVCAVYAAFAVVPFFCGLWAKRPARNARLSRLPGPVQESLRGLSRLVTNGDVAAALSRHKRLLARKKRFLRRAEERRRQQVRNEVLAAIRAEAVAMPAEALAQQVQGARRT